MQVDPMQVAMLQIELVSWRNRALLAEARIQYAEKCLKEIKNVLDDVKKVVALENTKKEGA